MILIAREFNRIDTLGQPRHMISAIYEAYTNAFRAFFASGDMAVTALPGPNSSIFS